MKKCKIFLSALVAFVLLLSGMASISAAPAQGVLGDSSLYASVPESMEQICEKGDFVLFASMKTGEFAVKNQATGTIWFSNPPDRNDDPYSGSDRPKTFSQLVLQYIEKTTLANGFVASYSAEIEDNITVTKKENGIRILYKFYDLKIAVPLQITLTKSGIKASVDFSKIREDGDKVLLKIGILPYFAAAGAKDTGYVVVPDGCGALIEFNSGRQNLASYNEPVYGRDTTLIGDTKTKIQENSSLPLFGMKNGEQGFAAIITKGDAAASVIASISKKSSGYNNIYSEFTVRSTGTVEISGRKMSVYEEGEIRLKTCEVEYRLLNGEKADYNGIAKEYSEYLLKAGVEAQTKENVSMLMEAYGAVRINRSVMGIPTKVTMPLTTFKQAAEMAEKLKQSGIENLSLLYSDYDKASIRGELPSKIKADSKLGGKSGLKKLKSKLDELGFSMVSVINLNTYQNGALKNRIAARSLGGLPGITYDFDLSTNEADEKASPYYHLSPSLFSGIASKLAKKYDTKLYGNLGLDDVAETLYSDFSKKSFSSRQQTVSAFSEGLKTLSEKSKLYIRGGSAWALKYTDYIYDMPSDTSKSEIESMPIPLYQLAVSGIVPYSIEPVNRFTDADMGVLKCAEYGADLKYDFTADSAGIIGESNLGYLNGVWFEQWEKHAETSYKRLAEFSDILSGKMLKHEKVAEDVFVTTYEGGKMAVNYSEKDCKIGNTVVKAKDFALIEGVNTNGN